jgi:hypothetical protein
MMACIKSPDPSRWPPDCTGDKQREIWAMENFLPTSAHYPVVETKPA